MTASVRVLFLNHMPGQPMNPVAPLHGRQKLAQLPDLGFVASDADFLVLKADLLQKRGVSFESTTCGFRV